MPRLYLATPVVDDPQALLPAFPQLLAQTDVAAVLVRLKTTDQRTMISTIKALAPAIQDKGAALLLEGHVELVARAGADGAHVAGIEALQDALPTLKPDRIAGAGALKTRHDSMTAGEMGADYVLFGEPDRRGNRPQWGAVEDRVKWWADLVEVPCIGYAGEAGEVRLLAQAGADFVALGDWIWTHPQGAAAAVTMAASALAEPVP